MLHNYKFIVLVRKIDGINNNNNNDNDIKN